MQREKQETTFRSWITEHQGILVHTARGFVGPADEDDLLQEMLLAVWHAIPSFRGDASAATFLYRIAQNTALTWRRKRMRRPVEEVLYEDVRAAPEVSPKAARTQVMYRAIRRLPELDRSLVLLYLDSVSYRDMASILGLSESNVGARLTRARDRLAGLVKDKEEAQ